MRLPTAGVCLLIEGFLNVDTVRGFTENDQADKFRSVKAVCPVVVGFH